MGVVLGNLGVILGVFPYNLGVILRNLGVILGVFPYNFGDPKPCASPGALPPAGRNPQFWHFYRIFKSRFSRVFELWAECSLFRVQIKDTRTDKLYRMPVESYSNL